MPPSRLLDAAVGLGQLAEKLRSQRHRVVGLDSSFEAALQVRSKGIPVVIGDLTALPFRPAVFDGVTSGETLEHLENDRAAVEEMHRVMRTGGQCVITVPAFQLLWSRSDDYYEHRRRYTRHQLAQMFGRAAFEVKKARFWGFPTVLLYELVFLLPLNRRRAGGNLDGLRVVARAGKSRWLVDLVKAIFSIDRVFSFVPFGPGLVLVAEKKNAVIPSEARNLRIDLPQRSIGAGRAKDPSLPRDDIMRQ